MLQWKVVKFGDWWALECRAAKQGGWEYKGEIESPTDVYERWDDAYKEAEIRNNIQQLRINKSSPLKSTEDNSAETIDVVRECYTKLSDELYILRNSDNRIEPYIKSAVDKLYQCFPIREEEE